MTKYKVLMILALAMAGCGGGGGGGGSAPPPSGGGGTTPPPPVATAVQQEGVVTGFSSVYVDGVKYEVESDTSVSVDEEESVGDDSPLRVGMKVLVSGSEQDGVRTASNIVYSDDLKGPVMDVQPDSQDPTIGRFSVLKQSVLVDANTIFDDNIGDLNEDGSIDIGDLAAGSTTGLIVEVSGYPVADGVLATRIERETSATGDPNVSDDEYELKGFVDSVAEDGSNFTINNALITVTGSTLFEDGLVADESLVGVYVEVKLDIDSGGNYVAVNVKAEDDYLDSDGDGDVDSDDRSGRVEIKGILQSIDTTTTPATVVIGSRTIEVSDVTSLEGKVGTLIELKGTFNSAGVFVIDEVEVEIENSVRTEDQVETTDNEAVAFTTRLGLTITPTGRSRVENDIDDDGDHLRPDEFVSRLAPGSYIEARGYIDSEGTVVWTRIENEEEDDNYCKLQGPVESITGDVAGDFSFTIQGVTIDVSNIVSDSNFEGPTGASIGRDAFFAELAVGKVVKAKSDDTGNGCENGRLTAREVEYELDDGVIGSVRRDDDDDDSGSGSVGREIIGIATDITENSFVLDGETILVTGNTLIDDSLIETALGREFDGDDQRFDQLPTGITLADLLAERVKVRVDSEGNAIEIEDVDDDV